jgi:glycosyltransferase involved in cell wall biosynthesis
MACGTPVIAFKRGSIPEVISKETGFIVNPFTNDKKTNYKGSIEASKNVSNISRKECRKWVEENFTKEKMVKNYERLYYKIINKK